MDINAFEFAKRLPRQLARYLPNRGCDLSQQSPQRMQNDLVLRDLQYSNISC